MNDYLIVTLIVLLYFSPVFYHIYLLIKDRKEESKKLLRKILKFTKYSFLLLIFTSIIFAILSHTNYLNYEKPLTYDKYDLITFKNFRGLEFFKKNLYGNERFAYVVTSIETDINNDSIEIYSLFHPSRSFVYKQNTISKELLTHEKYHFKITELFVRKMKQKISTFDKVNEETVIKTIEDFKQKERKFQKSYDYDTFHSYVLTEQKKYEKEVDSLLDLLSEFRNPKIKINYEN